ncbi:MAG: substrate-binding domain-containing protein [Methanomicrobiales archaeon]|nr:substrate-binding domain-containing protein [Methanomicrobiales archaeon]
MDTTRFVPVAGVAFTLLLLGAWIAGCTGTPSEGTIPLTSPRPMAEGPRGTLLMATTTSLYDTGLLDFLRPDFEKEFNADVRITSQGTGKAMELAKRGDVDILLVHDPAREIAFMDEGYGINHRCFAYNYFIIVGPASDPAVIAGMKPEDAFRKILTEGIKGTAGIAFVSRGDGSGTHAKEQAIWKAAGFNYTVDVQKTGAWYIEAGKGMGETLVMASEKGAYTLTDEGTYLAFKGNLQLTPLIEQGEILRNVYSAITINPDRFPNQNATLANQFITYLLRDTTQQKIASFGKDRYGKGLFSALQGADCVRFGCDCTALAGG